MKKVLSLIGLILFLAPITQASDDVFHFTSYWTNGGVEHYEYFPCAPDLHQCQSYCSLGSGCITVCITPPSFGD